MDDSRLTELESRVMTLEKEIAEPKDQVLVRTTFQSEIRIIIPDSIGSHDLSQLLERRLLSGLRKLSSVGG